LDADPLLDGAAGPSDEAEDEDHLPAGPVTIAVDLSDSPQDLPA
jgi:hypothetical protein